MPYVKYIPDHLVLLTVSKALALKAVQDQDVEQAARYEAVFTQLVNIYNLNIVETEPSVLTRAFGVTPYVL